MINLQKTPHKPFEKLDNYLNIAKFIISGYCTNKGTFVRSVLSNEDSVTTVASEIMRADIEFNGNGNLKGYRKQRAIWIILRILNDSYIHKHRSLDNMITNNRGGLSKTSINRHTDDDRSPVDNIVSNERRQEVWNILENAVSDKIIARKSANYMIAYFRDGLTLEEVANIYDVSKQAVEQNIAANAPKLKSLFEEVQLDVL